LEILNVSEQNAEQSSGEPGSLSAGPAVPNMSDVPAGPVAAPAREPASVESPKIAPDHEAPLAGTPKVDAPRVEAAKPDTASADAPRAPGKVLIMSAGDRSWEGSASGPEMRSEPGSGMFGKRRLSALAAVAVLAMVAGALGGALATAGVSHYFGAADAASAGNGGLEASIARIDADILALQASVERTSKTGITQFNKTSDRLDKVEKAQAEPAAKLAKLSEAVEKLRAAPAAVPVPVAAAPAAAAPAAARETTGSLAPQPAVPATPPKPEVAKLPTVEGWVLREVGRGSALIEGRRGIFEVYAGDPVPGLGRIDAIRRQDGHWVVVTAKGLVLPP
jgi:hypothetical protein